MLRVVMLDMIIIMLCNYAECRYPDCRGAD
jgi:hypothetical protein